MYLPRAELTCIGEEEAVSLGHGKRVAKLPNLKEMEKDKKYIIQGKDMSQV